MNKLTSLSRYGSIRKSNVYATLYIVRNRTGKKVPSSSSSNSSSSSDSDEDRIRNRTNNEAVKKLNSLLQDMISEKAVNVTKPIELARPRQRAKGSKSEENTHVDVQPVDKKLVQSVKTVAESLGGNVKQTESELLTKLLSTSSKAGDEQNSTLNLSEIVKGMKIDKSKKVSPETSRANQVRSILQQSVKSEVPFQRAPRRTGLKPASDKVEKTEKIALFGSKPLGYFQHEKEYQEGPQLKTWELLNERELRLAVTHPPANYFQQMILWTEQGKIWRFPIDNEQGMEKEKNIYFTEHVFLEKHLEPWCPSKGPIRHFMELVCVGLSKNPYMSVEDKRGHLAWYKDYFTDKEKLLKEIGATPQNFKMSLEPPHKNEA